MAQAGSDADTLDRLTVANENVIADMVGQVALHANGRAARHCLVVGGFGAGKTHALTVALHRALLQLARQDVAVAWLPMGGVGITSYQDLLFEIAMSLTTVQRVSVSAKRQPRRSQQVKELERVALKDLPGTRPLIVVIENLDAVLNQLAAGDQEALTRLLTRRFGPLVLASSSMDLHQAGRAAQFSQFILRPLDIDEALALVTQNLREKPAGFLVTTTDLRADVASFNDLVHGNARFWTLAAGLLAAGEASALTRAFDAFLSVLDIHYSERLRSLAPSERRAVIELARAGRPQTVTELAELLGITNQSVASTLGRLMESRWVKRVEATPGSDKRLTWYDLGDPLLRHHVRRPDRDSPTDLVRHVQRLWHRQQTAPAAPEATDPSLELLEQQAAALGESGFPAAARDLYRRSLLGRVENNGLSSRETLQTLTQYGVWTGSAGATDKGREILQVAVRDADAIAGPDSEETLTAHIHLAWSDIEHREHEQAIKILDEVIDRATRIGAPAVGKLLHARQDRARALGELGDPAGAVHEFAAVLAARIKLYPADDSGIRTNRHGLAWWTGMAGDPAQAVAMFDEMLHDPHTSEFERLNYRLAAAHWAGIAAGPGEAARRYRGLADDLARSPHADSSLAREARRQAMTWSLAAYPSDATELPIRGVNPDDFATVLGGELLDGRLSLTDVAGLQATRDQADALAIACVFCRQRVPPRWRSNATLALAPLMTPAKASLILDFGRALAGDRRAESGLPTEWRPILGELHAIDADDGTQRQDIRVGEPTRE